MTTLSAKGWKTKELAKAYFHNSEIQRQCVWDLLGSFPFKEDEEILDFGCRDGKISAEISHFVKKGSVTGIDPSKPMIEFAKLYFPPTVFPNLQFIDLEKVPQGRLYDRVVSFYAFHIVSDPLSSLKDLYRSLKNGGKLFAVVPTEGHPNMMRAAHDTLVKYQLPIEAKKSPIRNVEWARDLLTKAGFKITYLQLDERPCPFADAHEMIDWMVGTYSATMGIPLAFAHNFFTEVFRRWVELDTTVIDRDGRVNFRFNRLKIVGQK
jgi:trans-aconitate 2-methyltransferase